MFFLFILPFSCFPTKLFFPLSFLLLLGHRFLLSILFLIFPLSLSSVSHFSFGPILLLPIIFLLKFVMNLFSFFIHLTRFTLLFLCLIFIYGLILYNIFYLIFFLCGTSLLAVFFLCFHFPKFMLIRRRWSYSVKHTWFISI